MKKAKKILLSVISLILIMAVVVVPTYASAGVKKSGSWSSADGSGSWVLYTNYTLDITGHGTLGSLSGYPSYSTVEVINIGEGITSTGNYSAPYYTETVNLPSTLKEITASTFYQTNLSNIVLPEGLETIGNIAFFETKLTEITIPSTVKTIGNGAFEGCESLVRVTFQEGGSCTLGEYVFRDCTALEVAETNGSLVAIGNKTFYQCSSLRDFVINDTVKTIGDYAFYDCSSLNKVILPNSVTSIGKYAFYGCTNVSEIKLSNKLTAIPERAFYECDAQVLSIPKSVTNIGTYAFAYMNSLEKVIFNNKSTKIDTNAFASSATFTAIGYPGSEAETLFKDNFQSIQLAAPKISSVTNYTSYIYLKWQAVSGAKGYKIYRKVDGAKSWTLVTTLASSKLTYKDYDINPGSSYVYTVRSIGEYADGKYSSSGIKIIRLSAPKAPTVSSTNKGITVKWNAIKGATSYYVYRAKTGGKLSKIATVTGKSYTDKSAVYGTTYDYVIYAVSKTSAGTFKSAKSAVSTVKSKYVITPTITSLKMKKVGSVEIKWDKISGATSYYVYRSTSSGSGYKKIATATKASYIDAKAKTGTKYYYKIVAVTSGKKSAYSPYKSITSTLLATTFKSASVTSKTIKLNWNKVSEADGYYVYRKNGSSWKLIKKITSASTTTYTDSVSGAYVYRVYAYKTINGKTYKSAAAEGTFRTLGKPSINVSMYNDEFKDLVKWKKITGATSYQVYRKVGNKGSWSKVSTVTTTQYIGKVKHGVWYYWKVRPVYSKDGCTSIGAFSAEDVLSINQLPKISVWVSEETSTASAVFLYVTNNGDYPITFKSSGARIWNGADYPSMNGSMSMIDYDKIDDGYLQRINSYKIPAHSSAWLAYQLTGVDTYWYDHNTRLTVYFSYGTFDYVLRTDPDTYGMDKGTWTQLD